MEACIESVTMLYYRLRSVFLWPILSPGGFTCDLKILLFQCFTRKLHISPLRSCPVTLLSTWLYQSGLHLRKASCNMASGYCLETLTNVQNNPRE